MFVTLTSEIESDLIREETFLGKRYLIAPVIALVEGVVTPGNIKRPELALMKEFKYSLQQWNGLAAACNHPTDASNVEVSANSTPEIYDQFAFGLLFNARIDADKLKLDAFMDLERCEALGGEFQQIIDDLRKGTLVEVSTGIFCNTIERSGTFKGNKYDGIWKDIVPDHLAFLPNGRGACDAEMGCGAPRVNVRTNDRTLYTSEDHEGTITGFRTLKLPTPKSGETQTDFHSRCMGDKKAANEFPDESQRNAICYSQWNRKHKNSEARMNGTPTATSKYAVNDRVRVEPGKAHDEETKDVNGTIVEISTAALGIKFDGMDEVHHWYVDAEIESATESDGDETPMNNVHSVSLPGMSKTLKAYYGLKLNAKGPIRIIPIASESNVPHECSCEDKLNCACNHNTNGGVTASAKPTFAKLREKALSGASPEQRAKVDEAIAKFVASSEGISDQDLRTSLQLALDEANEQAGGFGGIIVAVFATSFVYVNWWSGEYMECAFTKDDQGNVTFDLETATDVRPMTSFVSTKTGNDNEESNMSTNANNAAAPANAASPTPKALSFQEALEAMMPEARAIAEEGMALRTEKLNALTARIMKAPGNKFSEAQLRGFSREQLEGIASLVPAEAAPAPATLSAEPKACAKCGTMNANSAAYCSSCGAGMPDKNKDNRSNAANDHRGNAASTSVNGEGANLRNQAAPGGGNGSEENNQEVKPTNLSEYTRTKLKENGAANGARR